MISEDRDVLDYSIQGDSLATQQNSPGRTMLSRLAEFLLELGLAFLVSALVLVGLIILAIYRVGPLSLPIGGTMPVTLLEDGALIAMVALSLAPILLSWMGS